MFIVNSYQRMHSGLKFLRRTPTLAEAFKIKMEQFERDGKVNSYYRVRSAKRAFERYGGPDIHFGDITPEWLAACDRHWRAEGKSTTTIVIYMKALKVEMNEMMRQGLLKPEDFPFGRGRYEMPSPKARKMALNKEQIKEIALYQGNRTIERYRDLWLFSYLCNGINFRDMLFLRYRNVCGDEIVFYRSKTEHSLQSAREIRAAFTPAMRQIIARWGNPFDGNLDTFLFKYAKGNEADFEINALVRKVTSLCNRQLKRLAETLDIPEFTTYSARHSFATILNRNGVDIKYISDCLGHSSIKMTETYLAGFTENDRKKYSKMLL